MYKFRKKGISPLIATVLIIGFTVALAAVIMTWGQGFSKSMQQSTEATTNVQLTCAQDVLFEVKSVCYVDEAVDTKVKITVANNGNKGLKSITARLKETESLIQVITLDDGTPLTGKNLDAFGLKVFEVTTLAPITGADKVTEVELIPVIDVSGKEVTCASSIAKFGDVVKAEPVAPCA